MKSDFSFFITIGYLDDFYELERNASGDATAARNDS